MNNDLLDLVKVGDEGKSSIVFSGDLTFDNITAIKDWVDEFFIDWRENRLNICVQNVDSLDLSFLQLLEVIHAKLKQEGKEIAFTWTLDDELRLLLKHTGFEKYT